MKDIRREFFEAKEGPRLILELPKLRSFVPMEYSHAM